MSKYSIIALTDVGPITFNTDHPTEADTHWDSYKTGSYLQTMKVYSIALYEALPRNPTPVLQRHWVCNRCCP